MNKAFLSVLSLMLVGTTLASCGSGAASSADNTTSATNAIASTEAETTAPDPFNGMKDVDYGGRAFTIFARKENLDELWTENQTGEVLNDAVYDRNRAVEEKFNTVIKQTNMKGTWPATDYLAAFSASVTAGDGAYDMVDYYAACFGSVIANHLCLNLNEVDELRLDESWWSALVREELTINGRLFGTTGDLAMNLWEQMHVVYFNKQLLADHKLESPYDLVDSGKWTYDKFLSMFKGVYVDVNGDGDKDEGDHYGLIIWDELSFDNFRNSFGIRYSTHNKDGSVTMDLYNERTIKVAELGMALAYENADVWYPKTNNVGKTLDEFKNDQGLFYLALLGAASSMREMDSDFGILPYPKEDEKQEGYFTTSRDSRSTFGIPIDAKDISFAGTVMEGMCVMSSSTTIPVFIDKALKGKTARDEESGRMLDIIRAGFVLDFALEYGLSNNRAGYLVRDCITNHTPIASWYEMKKGTYAGGFEDFVSYYYDKAEG